MATNASPGNGRDTLAPNQPSSKGPYTSRQKWFIVTMIAYAGLFSPFTANIYFPAIPDIAAAFHKSTELINLTVTMYLVFQGVSPMFWGTLSDLWGRRPIFLACLLTLLVSCVGLALVPTSAYWLLLLLRCLQAAGSASTIALGAGVIGDISSPDERGSFFGFYALGPMIGPSIGPVIGGALAGGLGWRSIFWFLCIASAMCLVFIFLFLPETLRSITEKENWTPSLLYRPVIPIINRSHSTPTSSEKPVSRPFVNLLRLFTYPDVVLILVFTAIVYAVYTCIVVTISTSFKDTYPFLSETDIGLCFLASGGGMVIGSIFTGKFLDWDYRTIKKQMISQAETDPEKRISSEDASNGDINFPIEKARLRTMPIYVGIYAASTVAYGWCLQKKVHIAGPLILLILIGYVFMAVMNTTQTLIIDLVPAQSSSITACNNLVRCSLAALAISVIDIIFNAIGVGWTDVLLALLCCMSAPVIYVVMRIGPGCRAKRRTRLLSLSATLR